MVNAIEKMNAVPALKFIPANTKAAAINKSCEPMFVNEIKIMDREGSRRKEKTRHRKKATDKEIKI